MPAIVSMPNTFIIRTQGTYKASKAGQAAVIIANGDPKCIKVVPPCGMPSVYFTIQISVA